MLLFCLFSKVGFPIDVKSIQRGLIAFPGRIDWSSENTRHDNTSPQVINQARGGVVNILGPCHLNLALCMLKLEEFEKVVANCELVLKLSSKSNAKARYRAGKALVALCEYERAQVHLSKIRSEDMTKSARDLIADCLKHVRMRAQEDRRIARLMFKPKVPKNI